MLSWLLGGGMGVGFVLALWQMERARRFRQERDGAKRAAALIQAQLDQERANKTDAERRLERVAHGLKEELARCDAELRPVAGDVAERLRRLFEAPDGPSRAGLGLPQGGGAETASAQRGRQGWRLP